MCLQIIYLNVTHLGLFNFIIICNIIFNIFIF